MMDDRSAFERQLAREVTRMAGPEPSFDALAVARSAMTEAPAGRLNVVTRLRGGFAGAVAPVTAVSMESGPSMFSALKFVVAGVIVALFGGLLLVGTLMRPTADQPGPAAATESASPAATRACPPGSTPDMPGPTGQARPPQEGYGALDFLDGKLIQVAKAGESIETWLFDVCTNTWSLAKRGPVPAFKTTFAHAYDPSAGLEILVDDESAWAYDASANSWTELAPPPADAIAVRLAYDVDAGQLVARSRTASHPMWTYDTIADTWQPITQAGADRALSGDLFSYDDGAGQLLAYDYDSGHVQLFDRGTGTWRTVQSPPRLNLGWLAGGNEIAYDESSGRTVVFSDGQVVAYDPAADAWETLYQESPASGEDGSPIGPLARHYHSVVYDPFNQRLVMMGGEVRTGGSGWPRPDDVWAFDMRTREWTELLAPTRWYPGHAAIEQDG